MAKYADAVKHCIFGLKMVLQRPTDVKWGAISGSFYVFLAFYYNYLTVLLMNEGFENGDIDLVAQGMEGVATYSQLFIKLYPVMAERTRLRRLLKLIEEFWDSDNFPEIADECTNIYKMSYYFQRIYQTLIAAILVLFHSQPILTKGLIMDLKLPNYPHSYEIVLGGQYIVSYVTGCLVGVVDSLFLCLCTHIYVQVKLLGYAIKTLNFQDKEFEFKFENCMKHHRLLLKFADDLKEMFSYAFLVQFILSIYLPCMELYILIEGSLPLPRIITSVMFLAGIVFQLGIICFPAHFASYQMSEISADIYNSNWYEGTVQHQQLVIFVLMRSNKPFKITGANLVTMNIETFTEVFKTSMSMFMLLRQINEE